MTNSQLDHIVLKNYDPILEAPKINVRNFWNYVNEQKDPKELLICFECLSGELQILSDCGYELPWYAEMHGNMLEYYGAYKSSYERNMVR